MDQETSQPTSGDWIRKIALSSHSASDMHVRRTLAPVTFRRLSGWATCIIVPRPCCTSRHPASQSRLGISLMSTSSSYMTDRPLSEHFTRHLGHPPSFGNPTLTKPLNWDSIFVRVVQRSTPNRIYVSAADTPLDADNRFDLSPRLGVPARLLQRGPIRNRIVSMVGVSIDGQRRMTIYGHLLIPAGNRSRRRKGRAVIWQLASWRVLPGGHTERSYLHLRGRGPLHHRDVDSGLAHCVERRRKPTERSSQSAFVPLSNSALQAKACSAPSTRSLYVITSMRPRWLLYVRMVSDTSSAVNSSTNIG